MTQVEDLLREVSAEIIEPRFAALQDDDVWLKSPGEVVTIADEEAEQFLARRLGNLLPGDGDRRRGSFVPGPPFVVLLERGPCLAGRQAGRDGELRGGRRGLGGHGGPSRARRHRGLMHLAAGGQGHVRLELGQGATRNSIPIRRTQPVPPISRTRGAILTRFLDRCIEPCGSGPGPVRFGKQWSLVRRSGLPRPHRRRPGIRSVLAHSAMGPRPRAHYFSASAAAWRAVSTGRARTRLA